MEFKDIIFKSEEKVFSYRIGGILIHNGKVLLQKPTNDNGYSIPGGHVNFGETSEEALIREFKEEINVDINPVKLIWVGENFFPWGKRECQQISLYYLIELCDTSQICLEGKFYAIDTLEDKSWKLEFSWVSLSELNDIVLYPYNAKEMLCNMSNNIEHFIYKQIN